MPNDPEVPYVPPARLISGSLTALQVTAMFEEFCSSLRYVSTSPELVFERLVTNLCDVFKVVMEEERHQYTRELDSCRSTNERLEAELSEFKRRTFERDDGRDHSENQRSLTSLYSVPYPPLITSTDFPDTSNNPLPTPSAAVAKQQRPNPVIGSFDTLQIRYWFKVRAQTSKIISFGRPYPAPPGLPVGLTTVDISKLANVRVKSYTSGIRNDGFEIHLDSWADTFLLSAACTWLEIEADDPDFQFGRYSTLDDRVGEQWQQQNSRPVVFARPYDAPPCVVVWLSGFDMRREKNWRIKAYASDVTAAGFTIHIDTWEDTVLYSGMATWVAYTAGRSGVCSGSFATTPGRPRKAHAGDEKFETGVFEKCPRIAVALNMIDISCSGSMKQLVKVSGVSTEGMKWHLEGWLNTDVNAAGGSYIALS